MSLRTVTWTSCCDTHDDRSLDVGNYQEVFRDSGLSPALCGLLLSKGVGDVSQP